MNKVLEDKRAYHEAHGKRLGLPAFTDAPSTLDLDKHLGAVAGQAFQDMEHRPRDPEVRAAYAALKAETKAQYDHLVQRGARFTPWTKPGQPYSSSKDMQADVVNNRHLYYFPSSRGFGGQGDIDEFGDHPLMDPVPGMPGVVHNDLFRAVHDWFAHAMHGHQFGPKGELRAWHEHARMFSPLARKALTTETHGQNSWVNFGKHLRGDEGPLDKPYADQKAGLLPEHAHPKVKLARPKKAQPHPEEQGFTGTIWKQWQAWRKHLADNERRGRPDVYEGAPPIMDDNARLAFADWLAERGDPREPVVRGHKEKTLVHSGGRVVPSNIRDFRPHPMSEYGASGYDHAPHSHSPGGALAVATGHVWDFAKDLIHPGDTYESFTPYDRVGPKHLPSVVWRHAGVTTSRSGSDVQPRFREHPVMFHAPVTVEQYMQIADTMEPKKRAEWHAFAKHHGWVKDSPVKLARLTASAPRPKPTWGGDIIHHHVLTDEAGKTVAHVAIHPRNEGKHLRVEWIGRSPMGEYHDYEKDPNTLGREAMRTALRSVLVHYPNAEFISGKRISGARTGTEQEGESVVVPINRLKLSRPEANPEGWRNGGHGYWIDPEGNDHHVGNLTHSQWFAARHPEHGPIAALDDKLGGNPEHNWPAGWHHVSVSGNKAYAAGFGPLMRDQKEKLGLIAIRHRAREAEHTDQSSGTVRPVKLARATAAVTGLGAANRQEGSDNHAKRLELARAVLREAGLRGKVASVLAHGASGSRPSVAVTLAHTSGDQHALYAAAWIGLMTQQPSVTVFHPGEGEDTLHVVQSPHPVAHVSDYLRKIGVRQFVTEPSGTGTKAYMINPDQDHALITRGLDGSHSSYDGRADRIGAGSGAGPAAGGGSAGTSTADAAAARAGYRTVIRDAERAAGA